MKKKQLICSEIDKIMFGSSRVVLFFSSVDGVFVFASETTGSNENPSMYIDINAMSDQILT